jgi:hypothetical protein
VGNPPHGGPPNLLPPRGFCITPLRSIADRAHDAYRVVEEAHEVDPRDESGLVAMAKRLRMELLQTKAELERELGNVLLHCRRGNRRMHWVPGVGPESGHWAHAEPSRMGHKPELGAPQARQRRPPLPVFWRRISPVRREQVG